MREIEDFHLTQIKFLPILSHNRYFQNPSLISMSIYVTAIKLWGAASSTINTNPFTLSQHCPKRQPLWNLSLSWATISMVFSPLCKFFFLTRFVTAILYFQQTVSCNLCGLQDSNGSITEKEKRRSDTASLLIALQQKAVDCCTKNFPFYHQQKEKKKRGWGGRRNLYFPFGFHHFPCSSAKSPNFQQITLWVWFCSSFWFWLSLLLLLLFIRSPARLVCPFLCFIRWVWVWVWFGFGRFSGRDLI